MKLWADTPQAWVKRSAKEQRIRRRLQRLCMNPSWVDMIAQEGRSAEDIRARQQIRERSARLRWFCASVQI